MDRPSEPGRRPSTDAPLSFDEAQELLRAACRPFTPPGRIVEDEFGGLAYEVSVDITQLDADALHDRLAAWLAREVDLPGAHADVSFQNATPQADEEESDADTHWAGVAPRLRLEMTPPPTRATVVRLAALVPRFLEILQDRGRPLKWRDVEHGAVE
ncbi:MAG: hypothetical protein ACYDDF_05570 [Thermoplasmatota archaeon]